MALRRGLAQAHRPITKRLLPTRTRLYGTALKALRVRLAKAPAGRRRLRGTPMPAAGYIGGAFVVGEGDELLVENPSDGSEMARFPGLSADQFGAAISAARQAFDGGD